MLIARCVLLVSPLRSSVLFAHSFRFDASGFFVPRRHPRALWPDCGGGVTTNRFSVLAFSSVRIIWFILLIVFCYPTVCRVADERLALARASVLSDLHATCDVGAAEPACCSMRALFVWTE